MTSIRPEHPDDAPAIHRLNVEAFGGVDEAKLVERLRRANAMALSLVAELNAELVGHILFSSVTVTGTDGSVHHGLGLAPMAVAPKHQRTGIGSALIRAALAQLASAGHPFVVVLGHPEYYPRFGFVPASSHHIRSTYDAPGEAFMVLELRPGGLENVTGLARYRPEFDQLEG